MCLEIAMRRKGNMHPASVPCSSKRTVGEEKAIPFEKLQGKLRTIDIGTHKSGATQECLMKEVILEMNIEACAEVYQADGEQRAPHAKKSIEINSGLRDSRQCVGESVVKSVQVKKIKHK